MPAEKHNNPRERISEARRMEISELAEGIHAAYFSSDCCDPIQIADKKKITHSFNHYDDAFDGMLECLNGRFHIYGNLTRLERANSERARFTIAHELGHYFIDEHRNALASGRTPMHKSKTEFESKNLVEQEADHFAANLLMPMQRFFKAAQKAPLGFDGIYKLAKIFGSSLTSTAVRYVQCELVPCAVIKWNPDGFAWRSISVETSKAKLISTVTSKESLPCDSATALALSNVAQPSNGVFQCGTTASAWFRFVSSESEKNPILIEQAIRIGRFGVLTFLFPESKKF